MQIIISIFKKEILLFGRALNGIISLVSVSLAFLFICHYSLERNNILTLESLVGLKWALVFLLSFILIGQSLYEERESGASRINLALVPIHLYFLVKSFTLFLVLALLEIFLLIAFSWFFREFKLDARVFYGNLYFLLPATLSLTFIGIALGSLSSSTRLKEVLLPVLQIPLSIPVLIFGMEAEKNYLFSADGIVKPLIVLFCFGVFYASAGIWILEMGEE
jgi:heme exporter protein B